jgi:hypothetical protein
MERWAEGVRDEFSERDEMSEAMMARDKIVKWLQLQVG